MLFATESIALRLVDPEDTSYRISTAEPIDDLIESIRQVGLLVPPIFKKKHKKFTIISGFKRVRAVIQLGWSIIEARVVSAESNELQCVKLAIADNSVNRPLNFIEQARSVSILSKHYDDEALIREAKALGVNINHSLLKKLRQITQLPPELKKTILSGTISLTIALELEKLDGPSAGLLSQVFERLRPTFNIQKEILIMAKEIALTQNIPVTQLFNDPHFLTILNDTEISRTQKIQKIRFLLKKKRYPVITQFEKEFQNLLERIDLPREISLVPPEDFEGTGYALILNFQNFEEFTSAKEVLDRLMRQPDFRKILEKEIADHESLY